MDCKIATWNVRGQCKKTRQREVSKFIRNECLNVCVVIEKHLKNEKVSDIGTKVFGSWQWTSNSHLSSRGCRIMVGWDHCMINVMVVHTINEAILLLVKDINASI